MSTWKLHLLHFFLFFKMFWSYLLWFTCSIILHLLSFSIFWIIASSHTFPRLILTCFILFVSTTGTSYQEFSQSNMIGIKNDEESWEKKTWNVPPMLIGKMRNPFARSTFKLAVHLVRPPMISDIVWDSMPWLSSHISTYIHLSNRYFLLCFTPYYWSNLVFKHCLD